MIIAKKMKNYIEATAGNIGEGENPFDTMQEDFKNHIRAMLPIVDLEQDDDQLAMMALILSDGSAFIPHKTGAFCLEPVEVCAILGTHLKKILKATQPHEPFASEH